MLRASNILRSVPFAPHRCITARPSFRSSSRFIDAQFHSRRFSPIMIHQSTLFSGLLPSLLRTSQQSVHYKFPSVPFAIPLLSSLHEALAQTDTHKQKDAPPRLRPVGVTRTRDLVLPSATTLAPLATARASPLRNKKTLHSVPQFFYCSVPDNLFFRQAKTPTINRQSVQVHSTRDNEPYHFNIKTW